MIWRDLPEEPGGVDLNACPMAGYRRCWCGTCRICGFPKHTAIHAPLLHQPPGSKPWGHVFQPKEER
jgi:hypothetical protein